MAEVIEPRNPDPVLQSLEKQNAEINRHTELLKARNEIQKELGPDWHTIYCAMFGGAVAAVLFENVARIVLARHAWWEPLALFLAAFVAPCIALFAYRGACYCLVGYWTVLNKWEELRIAGTSALLAGAQSGDRAAQARVRRRSEKLQAREERRLAPRQPRLRR